MSGFMNIIHAIGSDPRAWVVLALFAARALWSVVSYYRCPTVCREQARIKREKMGDYTWRFVPAMLIGITLAVLGLFRLSHGAASPGVALFLLILGVYIFTTEPVRRQIFQAERKAADETGGPGENIAMADLRETHVKLLLMEFTIVALLLFGMLAL